MRRHRSLIAVTILLGLTSILLGLVSNVAAANLPSWLRARVALTWPALLVLGLATILLLIWQVAVERAKSPSLSHNLISNVSFYRRQMLDRVRDFWIDGVLSQTLSGGPLLDFSMVEREDLVHIPLNQVMHREEQRELLQFPWTQILSVFNRHAGAISIVGAPGAGKTTTLLELTKHLLDRALHDDNYPIPVVFPLSTWTGKRSLLADWLAGELHQQYDVPREIAQYWVANDRVLPLLDGLDELGHYKRPLCVRAINEYRQEHMVPIAITSTLPELGSAVEKLRLSTAVLIQPMTRAQIGNCIEKAGEPLTELRLYLQAHPDMSHLFETPLMLSLALQGHYKPGFAEERAEDTNHQIRDQIIKSYVDKMLTRQSATVRNFSASQTTTLLAHVARRVRKKFEPPFDLRFLELSFLPRRSYVRWSLALTLLSGLLLFIPMVALGIWAFGTKGGLVGGCLGLVASIHSVLSLLPDNEDEWMQWAHPLVLPFSSLMLAMIWLWQMFEWASEWVPGPPPVRYRYRTFNGARLVLAICVVSVACVGLIFLELLLTAFAAAWFLWGITAGSLLLRVRGKIVHAILAFSGSAPWGWREFLNFAARCGLLRKIGPRYFFTHSLLREYFASLAPSK